MKKNYEKPEATRVNFSFEDHVVANSSAGGEGGQYNTGNGITTCNAHEKMCSEWEN